MFVSDLSSNMRYYVSCTIDSNLCSSDKRIKFLVDTGAPSTTCTVHALSLLLRENMFEKYEKAFFGGYVSTSPVQYAVHYKYTVKNIKIGDIDLGEQNIWITFDNNVNTNLLGMDILSKINFMQLEKTNNILFFNDICELSGYTEAQIEAEKNSKLF